MRLLDGRRYIRDRRNPSNFNTFETDAHFLGIIFEIFAFENAENPLLRLWQQMPHKRRLNRSICREIEQQVRFPFVGLEARRFHDATGVAN